MMLRMDLLRAVPVQQMLGFARYQDKPKTKKNTHTDLSMTENYHKTRYRRRCYEQTGNPSPAYLLNVR